MLLKLHFTYTQTINYSYYNYYSNNNMMTSRYTSHTFSFLLNSLKRILNYMILKINLNEP